MTGHPYFIAWWYAILGDREESILLAPKEHGNPIKVL